MQQHRGDDSAREDIPTIRPFSCGTEFADWENHNCAQCANTGQQSMSEGGEYVWGTCELEDALTIACIGSGLVPELLAIEYGWGHDPGYWVAPPRCEKWVER